MGKRFLAVLLSMVVVVCALKSDVINVYAAVPEDYTEEYTEPEEADFEGISIEKSETEIDETEALLTEQDKIIEETEEDNAEPVEFIEDFSESTEEIKDVSGDESFNDEPSVSDNNVEILSLKEGEELVLDEEEDTAELFLATKMITAAVPSGAVVSIEDGGETDEDALMKSITASVIDSEGNATALDESSETIMSLYDTIKVVYTFKEPLIINMPGAKINNKIEGCHVVAGQHYKLPSIPSICTRPEGYEIEVKNDEKSLGVLRIDAEGNAVLEVSDSFTEMETATDSYAGFELALNLTKEANGDVDRYELVFGHTSYTVRIREFMPQGPKVSKTASDVDSEGNITWTVTLTNADKPIEYTDGYSITDTFSAGQDYVEGSLCVAGGETLAAVTEGNTISWNYKDNTASKVTSFQYKTHLDLVSLTKDLNVNDTVKKEVSNNVTITAPATEDYDALSITAKADKEVSKTVSKWVDKSGTDVDATGKATWTIVVTNNGFTFKNVVLHDKIVADSGVVIAMENLVVKDSYGNDVSFTEDTTDGIHSIHFTDDMTGDAVYTVTYDTVIQNYARYLKENHSVPTNAAWLSYEYEMFGTGEWMPVEGPGVETYFTGSGMLAKGAIEKTAAGVDKVNHTMDWLVEVNGNEQDLTGVSVIDAIPDGQDFVEIKDVMVAGAAAPADAYTVDSSDA
ncbi:MAG: isopeptide-forming domain-containing fimbrial protein, partial [Lachnospiraceae bacterium]|nr:isopeptide-forming domain-containing fimbrial protein [Lachnospiraceae bacterium]